MSNLCLGQVISKRGLLSKDFVCTLHAAMMYTSGNTVGADRNPRIRVCMQPVIASTAVRRFHFVLDDAGVSGGYKAAGGADRAGAKWVHSLVPIPSFQPLSDGKDLTGSRRAVKSCLLLQHCQQRSTGSGRAPAKIRRAGLRCCQFCGSNGSGSFLVHLRRWRRRLACRRWQQRQWLLSQQLRRQRTEAAPRMLAVAAAPADPSRV